MLRRASLIATAALLAASASPALSQGEASPLPDTSTIQSGSGPIEARVIARDLVHPWALALLPDGRVLVSERNDGRLRIVDESGKVSEPVEGVPSVFRSLGETGRSQGGLFDVKLHPGFQENQQVYLSLSRPTERGASVTIVRGRLEEGDGQAKLTGVETIFDLQDEDQDSSGIHFGGRMVIDADRNHLYLSVGERRNISRAQDGEDQAGSILRMTLDGAVPEDNPFVGDENTNDYIFAKGNRTARRLPSIPSRCCGRWVTARAAATMSTPWSPAPISAGPISPAAGIIRAHRSASACRTKA